MLFLFHSINVILQFQGGAQYLERILKNIKLISWEFIYPQEEL